MNILMMTNTYKPHVGGVANSVASFREQLSKSHKVLVVAPHFEGEKESSDVLRVNAIRNFNGSDFSLSLPMPTLIHDVLKRMRPDIVHSHHPFLLGNTALRLALMEDVPLIFTHHTLYERYTHYVPLDSPKIKELAINMAVDYSNICSCVIAPSQSIRELLIERGVKSDIEVIPTGIDAARFEKGERDSGLERSLGMSQEHFVIGHVSRLADEKNQHFLCRSVARFLQQQNNALFLLVGEGEIKEELRAIFEKEGVVSQVVFAGARSGEELVSLYLRMDLFVFASTSETQGMVLAEALFGKTPLVALRASGVSEMMEGKSNGILIEEEDEQRFVEALNHYARLPKETLDAKKKQAYASAQEYSLERSTGKLASLYQRYRKRQRNIRNENVEVFDRTMRLIEAEYRIWKKRVDALKAAI